MIFLVKQVTLAEQRDDDQPALVDILPLKAIQLSGSELERRWVQRNGNTLGKGSKLAGFAPMQQQPARQFCLIESAGPAIVLESLKNPETHVSPGGLQRRVQQLILAWRNHVVFRSVEEPYRRASDGLRVFAGKRRCLLPAFRRVAPEDASGSNRNCCPTGRILPRKLPRPISAHGEARKIGTRSIAVKFGRFLIELGHRHAEHLLVGPVAIERTLRHHHDERPALRVIANRCGQADLGLPHALGAALSAPMQKKNDRPQLVVVPAPIFWNVHLVAIYGVADLDAAVKKPCLLRRMIMRLLRPRRGVQQGWRKSPGDTEEGRDQSQDAVHRLKTS